MLKKHNLTTFLIILLGVVFKGKWGNKLVALKLLNSYQLNVFIKEGAKLRDLNHSNIVKLWGIFKGLNF